MKPIYLMTDSVTAQNIMRDPDFDAIILPSRAREVLAEKDLTHCLEQIGLFIESIEQALTDMRIFARSGLSHSADYQLFRALDQLAHTEVLIRDARKLACSIRPTGRRGPKGGAS